MEHTKVHLLGWFSAHAKLVITRTLDSAEVKMIRIYILLIALLFPKTSIAYSCSSGGSIFEEYEGASLVISAKAESIVKVTADMDYEISSDSLPFWNEITKFSVIRSWKGRYSKYVYIQTEIMSSCAVSFTKGEKHLLYLYGPDKNGYYSISPCSGFGSLDSAGREIEILKKIRLNQLLRSSKTKLPVFIND